MLVLEYQDSKLATRVCLQEAPAPLKSTAPLLRDLDFSSPNITFARTDGRGRDGGNNRRQEWTVWIPVQERRHGIWAYSTDRAIG